jgi:hypothetical protein
VANSERPLIGNASGEKSRLLAAISAAFRGEKMADDNILPAIVIAYDRAKNIAKVKPLIQWVDVNEGLHSRAPISDVPVLSLGGGGFHINFPIKANDLGWIFATDRDISLFKQSLAEAAPNTGRLHRFEDSMFVPDVFRKFTVSEEDAAAMVIQSTDGTTKIAISDGTISITATTEVKVKAPTSTFDSDVIIKKTLIVEQASTFQGTAEFDAAATFDAAVTMNDSLDLGGIDVGGHGHTSNSPGQRTIGGMRT